MNEPRDLIQRLEKNPQLPKGDGEILSVYGIESCPFASGDILCSRHVLASSFGTGTPPFGIVIRMATGASIKMFRLGKAVRAFSAKRLPASLCCPSRPTGTDHGGCALLRRAGLSGSSIAVRRSLPVR